MTQQPELQAPPHDLFSERAVLGALLIDNKLIDQVNSRITAEDFYKDFHVFIFKAIQHVLDQGLAADVITVADRLTCTNELKFVGGYESLSSLLDGIPENINIDSYLSILVEKSTLRKSLKLASRFIGDIMGPVQDPDSILKLRDELERLHAVENEVEYVGNSIADTTKKIERIQHGVDSVVVTTGFPDIDAIIGGYPIGDYTAIAALNSTGKTSFILSSMVEIACLGKKCLFFSLEMNRTKIGSRLLSQVSGVNLFKLLYGRPKMDALDWKRIDAKVDSLGCSAVEFIKKLPITCDYFTTDIDRIFSVAVEQNHRGLADIIFVDYLGMCTLSGEQKRYYSRTQDVTYFSGRFKALAKKLDVPVVVLVQLNRGPEMRETKVGSTAPKYRCSDLKDSSAIEHDAGVVAFLDRDKNINPTEASFIVAKGRDARTGQARLRFIPELAMFVPDVPNF